MRQSISLKKSLEKTHEIKRIISYFRDNFCFISFAVCLHNCLSILISCKVLNFSLSLVALFVYYAVIERRHPPLPFFVSIQYDTAKFKIFVPQTLQICLPDIFLYGAIGALTGSQYS